MIRRGKFRWGWQSIIQIGTLFLIAGLNAGFASQSAIKCAPLTTSETSTAEPSVVRAVLFWTDGCPGCHEVLEKVLPPIQQKYGAQLQVQLIELMGLDNFEQLIERAASLGVPKERVFVPFMVLGEHALIGPAQIRAELPGLIEAYLREGGLDWPIGLEPTSEYMEDAAPTGQQEFTGGAARAILFTTLDCHACRGEIAVLLGPIKREFGDRFEYKTIDIHTSAQVEYYYQLAATYGIEQERAHLPAVLIGERLLIGDEIKAELYGLVESHLAAGGIDFPPIPPLPQEVTASPSPVLTPPAAPANRVPEGQPDGYWLAVLVLIFLLLAGSYTAGSLVISWVRGGEVCSQSARQTVAVPVLALLGLAVAGYLAYVETQLTQAVCGPVGDCNAVQASPYARLFGLIPVGWLGVGGYLAILAAWMWGRRTSGRSQEFAALALTGMALVGTLFSLYLTFLEPFVIRAVCLWCLVSAVVITLLLLFSLKPAKNVISKRFSQPREIPRNTPRTGRN